MKMIHLQSNNPNNYGTVEFMPTISKEDVNVLYRVISINTTAAFSLTTDEDFITIQFTDAQPKTITFPNKGNYDVETLNKIFTTEYQLTVIQNDTGLIEISGTHEMKILEASHRVKLLLGLYHMDLPIKSTPIAAEHKDKIISKSIPYFEQGPIFYLMSRTGAICITNARGQEETQSIVYKTMELVMNSYPIASFNHGNWFRIKSSQLQQLKFILVDFMLEPVVLHSPIYITLEIIKETELQKYDLDLLNHCGSVEAYNSLHI